MKVLFVGNPSERPTDGGSASFQQTVLAGLQRMSSTHECSYVRPEPGKTIALARLNEELCTPDTAVQVVVDGQELPATVVRHPVYDPERTRVRS